MGRTEPPLNRGQIVVSHFNRFIIDPSDEQILSTAPQTNKPIIEEHTADDPRLHFLPTNGENLAQKCYTTERIQ